MLDCWMFHAWWLQIHCIWFMLCVPYQWFVLCVPHLWFVLCVPHPLFVICVPYPWFVHCVPHYMVCALCASSLVCASCASLIVCALCAAPLICTVMCLTCDLCFVCREWQRCWGSLHCGTPRGRLLGTEWNQVLDHQRLRGRGHSGKIYILVVNHFYLLGSMSVDSLNFTAKWMSWVIILFCYACKKIQNFKAFLWGFTRMFVGI